MTALFHYTCDHGRTGIGDRGELISISTLLGRRVGPLDDLIWMTDLDQPIRSAIGLTSHILDCDRTQHRYRVLDTEVADRWMKVRRTFDPVAVDRLESAPGVMPMHWWIARKPVPVELDSQERNLTWANS